jgi:ABC-2 type transport system permease protein
MRGSIISERIKVTSTKLWWILILVGVGLTVLLGILPMILLSDQIQSLEHPATMKTLWSSLGGALVVALILGIIAITGEFRHKTITDSFLLEPIRIRFLSAKLIVQAMVGVVLAIACVVLGVASALALLTLKAHAAIDWAFIAQVSLGVILAFALYAVLGVAVGALLTNQALAIVVGLLWVMLIEPLIGGFYPEVGKWLPGGAAQSVLSGAIPSAEGPPGATEAAAALPLWAGAVVLLAYAFVLTGLAMRTTLRRDIT